MRNRTHVLTVCAMLLLSLCSAALTVTKIPGRVLANASIRPSQTATTSSISIMVSASWKPETGPAYGSQFFVLTKGSAVPNFYGLGQVTSVKSSAPFTEAEVKGVCIIKGEVANVTLHVKQGVSAPSPPPYAAFSAEVVGGVNFKAATGAYAFRTPGYPTLQTIYSGAIQNTKPQ